METQLPKLRRRRLPNHFLGKAVRFDWSMSVNKAFLCVFIVVLFGFPGTNVASGESLKDIYGNGEIRLIKELKIDVDSFPESVYVKTLHQFVVIGDHVYFVDPRLSNIKVLSTTGKFIKVIGQKGKGPGDLYGPSWLTGNENKFVVWEVRNQRFSFFSAAGKFLKSTRSSKRGRIWGMGTLDNGDIVVERDIFKKRNKKYIQFVHLELYSSEMKFKKLLYQQEVSRFDYASYASCPFQPDVSWGVMPGNMIAVGFSSEYKFLLIDTVGNEKKYVMRPYTRQKVTEADKKDYFANFYGIDKNGKLTKGMKKSERKHFQFPGFKPAYKRIFTDIEGNILAFPYLKEDVERSKFKARIFDAFDSKGKYIGRVKVVSEEGMEFVNLVSVEGNCFWASIQDECDLEIVKFRAE
ncbi:MAG: hypothetical protein GY765_01195 [bacterium]|nr:hypothetical protein [bacterium]